MDGHRSTPRPWARWSGEPGSRPPWAVWASQRCDHQARTPADPQARAAADRLPDLVYCARPRGHAGDHAAPPRGMLAGLSRRGGWWSWPDDGAHREADRRDHVAVARTGPPPSTAAPGERVCGARGEVWHEAQAGRIGTAVWTEPVHCARRRGHDPPHATAAGAVSAWRGGRGTWWQWPAPPLPEPTAAQRLRARLTVALAVVVGLALVLGIALVAARG